MGVGLTICQSIIEGHGGRIWAEENKPAGTVFRFQLPIGGGSMSDGSLVVVIDDHESVRNSLRALLESSGLR